MTSAVLPSLPASSLAVSCSSFLPTRTRYQVPFSPWCDSVIITLYPFPANLFFSVSASDLRGNDANCTVKLLFSGCRGTGYSVTAGLSAGGFWESAAGALIMFDGMAA